MHKSRLSSQAKMIIGFSSKERPILDINGNPSYTLSLLNNSRVCFLYGSSYGGAVQVIPDQSQSFNVIIECAVCQVILLFCTQHCCYKWLSWWDLGERIWPPAIVKCPPGTFSKSWRITQCFGHIPVCANGVRPLKVCFAVLIGLDPFLHIKEPASWNSPILVEIEETILLSLSKSLESNYTVLSIVRVNLYPVRMFSSERFLIYN